MTEGLDHITRFPESCPVRLGRARSKTLNQFPYSIIYSLDARGIFILAFAHQRREPGYWADRL